MQVNLLLTVARIKEEDMARALFVPVDPTAPLEPREVARLEGYQETVGGWIEQVDIPALGTTIHVNEEGSIRQLPLNPRATFLWWFYVPAARQKAMLVGGALLVGMPGQRGDSTDVPNEVVTLSEPGHVAPLSTP